MSTLLEQAKADRALIEATIAEHVVALKAARELIEREGYTHESFKRSRELLQASREKLRALPRLMRFCRNCSSKLARTVPGDFCSRSCRRAHKSRRR